MSEALEALEKSYRDLVLKELRESNDSLKGVTEDVKRLTETTRSLEIVVLGYKGENGLRSKVNEISKKLEEAIPKVEKMKNEIEGENGFIKKLADAETAIEKLEGLRSQIIGGAIVLQVVAPIIWALLKKLGMF